ncbi:DUF302 domain-containing protein [Jatrophihabitans telluris]|uniref:DUF302 domain-containing protein n=1 Tax=Jatrophihabitans telluris TaxID=2038343 RepID=A0ABY4QUD2_9ACTN|nr:DUF302 domain-containing protein [Jatrophihabitans telluris]UQX87038.1 DUF302 domain-containing protein [Jatrophihabitans telluris]
MSDYGFSITLTEDFEPVVVRARDALAEQGFGILTEIDVAATMKAKLDVDMPPYLILGACNPPLAHQAIAIDASIGLLLPCNVVIRALDERHTLVEVMDPNVMVTATGNSALAPVADQARTHLTAALDTLSGPAPVARCG